MSLKLSELFQKKEYYSIVDDNYFINEGIFLLSSCFQIILDVDAHFDEFLHDDGRAYGLIFKLDETFYLCSQSGIDGDERGDIFRLNHPQIETFLSTEENEMLQPVEVIVQAAQSYHGIEFFMDSPFDKKPLIILSSNPEYENCPSSLIYFDANFYQKAEPIIEKSMLEQEVSLTQIPKKLLKM